MKTVSIIFILMLGTLFAGAQDYYERTETQTLFKPGKNNGWYLGFSMGYSQIDGEDALTSGFRGAFVFDQKLAIGLGGTGFVNNLDYHSYIGNDPDHRFMLAGGYGGIYIEPIIAGRSAVHLSFPVLLGVGGLALVENYGRGWDWEFDPYYSSREWDNDVFFVIEPGVELEFNLTRWFRAAAYASYRFTSDIELFETDKNVLDGFNFGMTFKFGKLN